MHMKAFRLAIFISFLAVNGVAQTIPPDSLYLGQTPPGNDPKIFTLPVDSGFFAAERIAISNDGSGIYYSEVKGYYPINTPRLKVYRYSGNHWTGPSILFAGYIAAGLSFTGDTMFFQNASSAYETFISVRNGQDWGAPKRILPSFNSAHYCQKTALGNYYISTRSGSGLGANDWCRLKLNGADTTALSLGLPLNTATDNLDFYISQDESYMIVTRPQGRLSVSYHKTDGSWTNPKSLGAKINFGLGAWGPFVTPDRKYLFYTTGTRTDYSDTYVYWVRVDNLVDSLRNTNFIPYLKNKPGDQADTVGKLFNYTIPDSTFVDDDGNNTLVYTAKLLSGDSLPAWLAFDPITRRFSGTPIMVGTLNLKVTATDKANVSVATSFKLLIKESAAINQNDKQGVIIFPNPSTGRIRISLDQYDGKTASFEILDLAGQRIMKNIFTNDISIDLADKPKGMYILKLSVDDEIIIRRICVI
jgi:hypothetical protein